MAIMACPDCFATAPALEDLRHRPGCLVGLMKERVAQALPEPEFLRIYEAAKDVANLERQAHKQSLLSWQTLWLRTVERFRAAVERRPARQQLTSEEQDVAINTAETLRRRA